MSPWVDNIRIIDVSATVAEMLDFKRAGTAKVKVEYVGKARMDEALAQASRASRLTPTTISVQPATRSQEKGSPSQSTPSASVTTKPRLTSG